MIHKFRSNTMILVKSVWFISVTKTHDKGLNDMHRDRKIVWVCPNKEKPNQYAVRLVQKYISLCLQNYFKKENFYLQSLQKPKPSRWDGGQVAWLKYFVKVTKTLMETAEIKGYFTNHSACRTGDTCFFQGGDWMQIGYGSNRSF